MCVVREIGVASIWASRVRRALRALRPCCWRRWRCCACRRDAARSRRSFPAARSRAASASSCSTAARRRARSPAAVRSRCRAPRRRPAPRRPCWSIRSIQIVGSTVYSDEQFAPLYRDLLNRQVTLQAVYDLAKRITAKYGADGYVLSRAIVPPQELSPGGATSASRWSRATSARSIWPREKLARYRDFFTDYAAKIIADRPVNIRTLERYLLLANDLPGLKFTTTLRGLEDRAGRLDADRRGHREAARRQRAVRQPRHQGARAATSSWSRRRSTTCSARTKRSRLAYAGVTQIEELQFVAPSYRQVLNSEGLTAFVNAQLQLGPSRHRGAAAISTTGPAAPSSKPACPIRSSARASATSRSPAWCS